MRALTIILGLLSVVTVSYAATDKVVCYYGSWASYRSGNGNFNVEDIDTNLCTHVIYSFVGLSWDGTVRILDTNNEISKNGLGRIVALKAQKPSLKVLIAIGGWNEGSTVYSYVVNNPTLRAVFVNSIVKFTKDHNFDGFDLDWEYPAQRGGAASDKSAYISLIKELRPSFDANGWLLTAAVAASSSSVSLSYDVPNMSKYLDFINVMTYDLHGSYDGVTGQNAPLYASSIDVTAAAKTLNVEAAINGWISFGASPSKLILGMGVYGRTYTLSSTANTKLGAPVVNAGNGGPYTAEPGFLGFHEICENFKAGGWTEVWDDQQKTPYAYNGNQWVGYDNQKSIELKTQFAIDKQLGGAMIWSLETDDAKNICGLGKFPILSAINKVINAQTTGTATTTTTTTTTTTVKPTTTTVKPTTTTTAATTTKATTTTTTTKATTAATTASPTTSSPSTTTECTQAGFIRDADDCSVFYRCIAATNGFTKSRFQCGSPLVFDTNAQVCNWESAVQC